MEPAAACFRRGLEGCRDEPFMALGGVCNCPVVGWCCSVRVPLFLCFFVPLFVGFGLSSSEEEEEQVANAYMHLAGWRIGWRSRMLWRTKGKGRNVNKEIALQQQRISQDLAWEVRLVVRGGRGRDLTW
jgi:hypothetical protein